MLRSAVAPHLPLFWRSRTEGVPRAKIVAICGTAMSLADLLRQPVPLIRWRTMKALGKGLPWMNMYSKMQLRARR